MAKKRQKHTKKSVSSSKQPGDEKVIVFFVTIALILFVLIRYRPYSYELKITDVTTEQIGNSNNHVLYYDVLNPTDEELDCEVTVKIEDKPYVNKIYIGPNKKLSTLTEVEMPEGDSRIEISSTCR